MGSSYTTHTLRGPSGPDVLEFLRRRGSAALVSSGSDGYVVVLDVESDWQGPSVFELARDLSRQFGSPPARGSRPRRRCHSLRAVGLGRSS